MIEKRVKTKENKDYYDIIIFLHNVTSCGILIAVRFPKTEVYDDVSAVCIFALYAAKNIYYSIAKGNVTWYYFIVHCQNRVFRCVIIHTIYVEIVTGHCLAATVTQSGAQLNCY